MTPDEPSPPLLASATSPLLADIKASALDPELRRLGLDPSRYELAYEWTGPEIPAAIPPAVLAYQPRLLLEISTALDIPSEFLTDPFGWRGETGERQPDPWGLAGFEQIRREYVPQWRYVSGGKVLHAFIGGSTVPACGIDPRRGPDLRPVRWIDSHRRRWFSRRSREHGLCRDAVRAHQLRMRDRAAFQELP